ncbi:MAG TPA: HlyD family efflux transporter periplasmic adaptor subunit [Ramlibacter sp.]|uniref:efflux RND transporter periplasmic adaptor subunit n=1 Tax=Ramlibacter sp. TaxID=1917967 RepID=UPI002D71EF85|nr:HlyD family efflux transporter periplasmic adaptor subunit [Ramlibacter sp.]HZY18584.1 HlyD family efflux transporter periplasmic adaptor subunit [Ramlibacter sp.]
MPATAVTQADAERLARQARDVPALAFSMVNDGWATLGYRQALVLRKRLGRWGVQGASGLVEVGEATPYQNWLARVAGALEGKIPPPADGLIPPLQLKPEDLPVDLAQSWGEWWPPIVLGLPLRGRDGLLNGLALFLFDDPPHPSRIAVLAQLADVWLHAWALLTGSSRRAWMPSRRTRWIIAGVVAAVLLVPVRQSVLAPAEIISLDSVVLASPVEGVVREVLVRPNQAVTADQPLVALDDTTLRNRREVLLKSLGSAQAELLATTQKSFENVQSRGDIAPLSGRVEERRAELAFVEEQLQRSTLASPKAGITVFGDPNDWRGRPVAAGERIMLVADPTRLGMLLHVPVGDAIAVDPGAPVRVFLHVAPLSPLDGEVVETGYQAMLSPDNVASYRIRAKLSGDVRELPRIGLKGTAKLYGKRVALGYWLLRRPIAAAREWAGF